MYRLDVRQLGYMALTLEAGIRWLFSEENVGPYAYVVRCGSALREKWPRIVAKAQQQTAASPEAKATTRDAKLQETIERIQHGRA